MPYILTTIGLIAAISIFSARISPRAGSNRFFPWQEVWVKPVAWVSSILFVVVSAIYPIAYAISTNTNAQLVAYSSSVHSAYHQTAIIAQEMKASKAVTATLPIGAIVLDVASWGQNKTATQRWAELRDKVAWYNTLLAKKRAWDGNQFLRLWIASPPTELKPIDFPIPKIG